MKPGNCKLIVFILIALLLQQAYAKAENNSKILIDCAIDSKIKSEIIMIADTLSLQNRNYILELSTYKKGKNAINKRPVYLKVVENNEYNGAYCYTFLYTDKELHKSNLPTYFLFEHGLYIAIYLKNRRKISANQIPRRFLIYYEENSINEQTFVVLICKETMKSVVIENTFLPNKAIKQIQAFSCQERNKDTLHIKFERPIIDADAFRKWKDSIRRSL